MDYAQVKVALVQKRLRLDSELRFAITTSDNVGFGLACDCCCCCRCELTGWLLRQELIAGDETLLGLVVDVLDEVMHVGVV